MKLTLSWLENYIDLNADVTVDDVVTKLTELGLEVDDVRNKAELYAPFKIAKVISAQQHPDADRLRVCQVETADGMIQVVCGAPNARAGMTAVFAPVGSYIPGLDVTLQKGVIRGQDSNGMLVSEREMALSEEHNGIIDLDDSYIIGTPITQIYPKLNEVTIEIGLTPNRADCAGIMGIARDLAAAGLGVFKLPSRPAIAEKFVSPVNVKSETPACPHFVGRTIRGVKNGDSPEWLKQQLQSIGLRPISALVDITNYFCIGMNRPLHVYDIKKLQGDIVVKAAQGGESFAALNDKSYTLNGGETVITDNSGVLGLGGIVGGESTGVDHATTDVFLECAYFDPTSISVTGRAHHIISDARYRFERGIDPEFLSEALDLATQMIVDLCGGEASQIVEAGSVINWKRSYDFAPSLTTKRTGVDIAETAQIAILKSLGFDIQGSVAPYQITPPSWRGDILGKEDIAEEVIRVYGFDKIQSTPLDRNGGLTQNALSETHALRRAAGRTLAVKGYQECITWSFMSHDLAKEFVEGGVIKPSLKLSNPLAPELNVMRPSILPNLIECALRNVNKGYPNVALFEVGPTFHGIEPQDQLLVAAGVRQGTMNEKHWASPDVSRPVDAFDAKSEALAVIQSVNPTITPQLSTDAPGWYHPGRSGVFRLGKNVIATFGEIHPAIVEQIDVVGPVIGFEVILNAIPPIKKKSAVKAAIQISPLQPVMRDFAFLVDADTAAQDIISATQKGGGKLVGHVTIFDIYQGKGVPEGKKSVAVSVRLDPFDKTLTDKDIEELSAGIIEQVSAKTGATLRG